MPSRPEAPVAALAATTTVGYGVLFYAYGVLLVPMHADLGWSRSFLSGAFSGALIVSALLTIPVGRWLDHHPPLTLFIAGSASACILGVVWALTRRPAVFVLTWALLGACQAILFYDPAFTVLTKWYDGIDRNRAITSVTLVAGLASTIFGPLTAALEAALGWRGAVLVLTALLGLVALPSFALGLKSPPRSFRARSGQPDDASRRRPVSARPEHAFRSRAFWLLTVAYLLSAITTYAVAVHLVSYLRDRGLPTGTAASILGAVGLVQVLGRSTFVRLSTSRPALHLATWVLAAKAVGLALLLAVPGPAGISLFVVIYGSANGMATLTRATTVAELYGPEHYGSISAVVGATSAIGGAVAPFAAAAAIDLVGSDGPVFAGLVVVSIAAAAANEVVAAHRRRVNRPTVELDARAVAGPS